MSSISYIITYHYIWIMWVLNPRNLFRKQMPYLWTNDPYSYYACVLNMIDLRETGIEPVKTLWKRAMLPLHHSRLILCCCVS